MTLVADRVFALVWRIIGLAVGIAGCAVMFSTTMGRMMLVYFTMQTNLFIVALFAVLTVMTAVQIAREGRRGEAAHLNCSFQLALTFYITITFVVYWALLSWQNFDMSASGGGKAFVAANYIVHGVVPALAIVDWVLFLPHGRVARSAAWAWLIYPAIYAVFIFVRAEVAAPLYGTTRYPYPFVDVDIIGAWVAAVVVVMAAAFYGLGRLYIFLDGKTASRLLRSVPAYARAQRPCAEDSDAAADG